MICRLVLITTVLISALRPSGLSAQIINLDLNRIRVDVSSDPGAYRELMKRFEAGDSTLTLAEMATVYYGFAFTTDYDPTDSYDEILDAYIGNDFPRALELCRRALRYSPVSLDLTVMALMAAQNGSVSAADDWIPRLQNRYDMISTVILSSGTGTTAESPFIVICEEDLGQIVRNVIRVDSVLGSATMGRLEAVKVTLPSFGSQHILYFDNSLQRRYEHRNSRQSSYAMPRSRPR